MNITATRLATKARTWLFIAGLTGLLIAIGGALGGGFLYLFVGLAVAMNFSTMPGRAPPSGFVLVARFRMSSA